MLWIGIGHGCDSQSDCMSSCLCVCMFLYLCLYVCMSVCVYQVSSLKQDLQVKEKQYEVRLQAVEDSHRHSTVELREMLTAQQQMSAKYVFHCSFLSAFYSLCVLCVVFFRMYVIAIHVH